jgi:rhodanese-related sulfurtransferase
VKRKYLIVVIPAAVLLAAGLYLRFGLGGDVDGAEARRLLAAGARLVDVRSPDEFAAGHLPDAINVPVASLDARLAELGPKDGTVIVYCHTGMRSSRAAALLHERGFTHVRNLGPMRAW